MNGQLLREWVRLSYHCPMSLAEYLDLDTWERYEINQQLDDIIDALDGSMNPPRSMR